MATDVQAESMLSVQNKDCFTLHETWIDVKQIKLNNN